MLRVYAMTTHSEVSLEGLGATVCVVATYLTGVADVEAMQLVEPVRYGLQATLPPSQRTNTPEMPTSNYKPE